MLRAFLALLLLTGAGEARAQFGCSGPTWAVATVRSYHGERPNRYEENNLGIGVELVCGERWRVVGGAYRNSKRDTSSYFGAAWMPLSWRELRAGAMAGLFSGYGKHLLPAGALVGSWERRRYGLNLLWFPPYEDFKGLLVLQLKRKF